MEYHKLPPQAINIEKSLLGIAIIYSGVLYDIKDNLTPEAFYNSLNKEIYKTLLDFEEKGKAIDILTIEEDLISRGVIKNETESYITEITEAANLSISVNEHIKIINDKYILRELIKFSYDTYRQSFIQKDDIDDYLKQKEEKFKEITSINCSVISDIPHISEISNKVYQKIENNQKDEIPQFTGIKTGMEQIDMYGGLQKQWYVCVTARPKQGKTSFVISMIRKILEQNIKVLYWTLEISELELTQKFISQESNVIAGYIDVKKLNHHELIRVNGVRDKINKMGLYIKESVYKWYQIINKTKSFIKQNKDCQVVVIDMLHLCETGQLGNEERISTISRQCKNLTSELKIVVIAICPMSRPTDKSDNRPRVNDIKYSNAPESDANVTFMLYRPDQYGIEEIDVPYNQKISEETSTNSKNIALIEVPSARSFPRTKFLMRINPNTMEFYDYSKQPIDSVEDDVFSLTDLSASTNFDVL